MQPHPETGLGLAESAASDAGQHGRRGPALRHLREAPLLEPLHRLDLRNPPAPPGFALRINNSVGKNLSLRSQINPPMTDPKLDTPVAEVQVRGV